jgi:hypothetical protein
MLARLIGERLVTRPLLERHPAWSLSMSRLKHPLSLLMLLAIGAVAACAPNGTTPTAASQPTAGPTTAPAASGTAVPSPGASATPAPKRYAVRNLDWKEDATDTRLGTAIAKVDYEGGLDEDNDGDFDHRARSEVTVGGQTHTIAFIENDKPLMSDEDDVTLIQDETTGEKLTFASDQEFNSFSVRQGAEKLTVEFDADGRVLVNGQAATSLQEAASLIAASSVGADCSLHSLTFLQGVLERREAEATRGNPSCMVAEGTSRNIQSLSASYAGAGPASYRIHQADDGADDGEDLDDEDLVAEGSDDEEADDLEDLSDAELEELEKELDALESEVADLLAELESFDEDLEDDEEEAEDAQDLADTHLNTNANLASQLVAEVIAKRLGK